MKTKETTCFLALKGKPCIRKKGPDSAHATCKQCLWNLKNNRPESLKTVERLYQRYYEKTGVKT
ncbi:MAG: hypothetical protein ACTSVI_06140 [Promethearchaeota archaeon]